MCCWKRFAKLFVVGLTLGVVPLHASPGSQGPDSPPDVAEGRSLDQPPPTWTSAGGPVGGMSAIQVLAADPSNSTRIFAGTYSGVFRTTDGGSSWSPLPIGIGALVFGMAVDPANPQVIYAAIFRSGNVSKSTDGGATWTDLGVSLGLARAVVVDSAGTVFLASFSTLMKSTTGGTSWTVSSGIIGTIYAIAIDPAVRTTVYVGTSSGVYKSTDGGTLFSPVKTGLTTTVVRSLAIHPTSTSTLYAGTSKGVFTSTNGGDSWTAAGIETAGLSVAGLAVTAPGTVFAAAGAKLFRSIDSGASWMALANGLPSSTTYATLATTSAAVYVGHSGGAAKSVDGGDSWQAINSGLSHTEVWSLAFDPNNPSRLVAGTNGQIYATSSLPGGWQLGTPSTQGTVWGINFVPSVPNLAYAAGFCSGVWESSDGGDTWTQHNAGLSVLCAEALVVDPIQPTTVYASTNDGIFKSVNGADSWTEISTAAMAWTPAKDYQALAIDPATPSTLYAAGGVPGGLFKTIDGGQTWSPMGSLPSNGEVGAYAVVVDPSSPSTVYIAAGGVYKSPNGGDTWTAAGHVGKTVRALLLVPGTPTVLYAGVEDENFVYRSLDGGANWVPFGAGSLPPTGIYSLVLSPSGDTLYAGTGGFGVYSLPTSASPCLLTCRAAVPGAASLAVEVRFEGGLLMQQCTGALAYDWDFGDNTPHSSEQGPSHTYGAAGTYTWTMTLTGAGSVCSQTGTIKAAAHRVRKTLRPGGR